MLVIITVVVRDAKMLGAQAPVRYYTVPVLLDSCIRTIREVMRFLPLLPKLFHDTHMLSSCAVNNDIELLTSIQ